MSSPEKPLVVVPGDQPTQIGDSPQLDRLRQRTRVVLHRDHPADATDSLARVADADVLLNSRSHVCWPAESLERLPKLKMITTCSIGTDMVDLEAARRLGIVVSNIPGKTAVVVAEHALGLTLAIAKRVAFQTAELKVGRWTRVDNVFLAGKTLGIVGTGCIGAQMARLGRAIGMDVIAWTFNPSEERAKSLGLRFVDFDELLSAADVLSLHVKLTPDSHHLIGREEFQRMKPGSLLVNTARGPVVDTAALIDALNSGHLAGAGIDVFDTEPLPADHPILSCEQIVLTPHHADHTPEGIELLNEGAVDNIFEFLDGNPQNVVS
ncbi:MAG: hypothetical protein CMJ81_12700 [Planctomycetaceae bacterium]|nr:hypothetical protein [Planctomycetaceae bacterium]